jgi:hypothetical protein
VTWCAIAICTVLADVSGAHAQIVFPRGDANCNLGFTAADAVAVSRSAGGSVCGNDDCTRDGVIDIADVDCGIACLFDECPTPPNAPEIAGIELESGDELTPYTTIHVIGNNVGSEDRLKRVTFNGVDGEVLDFFPPDEIVVLVPAIEPGLVEMAIHDGDLIGVRSAVDIAAQIAIGQPDTFDSTFDLIDTALARFAALPLDGTFGADALLVGSAIEGFRDELEQQRSALDADPSFTAEARAQLDAAFDSSSVPDDLREVIADIDAIENGSGVPGSEQGEGGAHQTVVAVANAARKVNNTIKVARAVLGAGAAVAATGLSAPAAIASVLAGVTAGVLTLAGSAALPPIILGVTFSTADARPVGGPTPGGFAVVRGRRLLGTNFVIASAAGIFVIPSQFDNDDSRQFRLPADTVGFCGRVNYYLERSFPLAGRSAVIPDGVIPQLQSFIGPNPIAPWEQLSFRALAISGCSQGAAIFVDDDKKSEVFHVVRPGQAEVRVPNVEPGSYSVYLEVEGRRSEPLSGLTVETGVTSVSVTCTPQEGPNLFQTTLLVPPGTPNMATCAATTLPPEGQRPAYSYFEWRSSDPGTGELSVDALPDRRRVTAKLPGTTQISAVLKVEQRSLATTLSGWPVRVKDETAPAVVLSSSSPGDVTAGGVIPVRVRATDNVAPTRIRITATGDPVLNGQQEFSCVTLAPTCTANFSVNIDRTFDRNQVTVIAEAFDGSGNMGTSAQLSFTVHEGVDETCPSLTIVSPPNGGTVNSGSTNVAMATATDEVGVKRFHYTATGDALVSNVDQQLTFPTALTSPSLNFNFAVKQAADLRDVTNRNIVLTVEAFDAAGNTCGAQTATVSVIGTLGQCEGSITTDNPSGYIDEPFTITVTITGDVASEINRVTSNNPGGQFDLTPRGNGVYQVTLFYQGTGAFTLSFLALDANSDERCSGSIGLEALGPKP